MNHHNLLNILITSLIVLFLGCKDTTELAQEYNKIKGKTLEEYNMEEQNQKEKMQNEINSICINRIEFLVDPYSNADSVLGSENYPISIEDGKYYNKDFMFVDDVLGRNVMVNNRLYEFLDEADYIFNYGCEEHVKLAESAGEVITLEDCEKVKSYTEKKLSTMHDTTKIFVGGITAEFNKKRIDLIKKEIGILNKNKYKLIKNFINSKISYLTTKKLEIDSRVNKYKNVKIKEMGLSRILCVRHMMATERSPYAEEEERGKPPSGSAVHDQA